MDDLSVKTLLAGLLLITLAAAAWTGVSGNALAEKAVPKFYNAVYCAQVNGTTAFSFAAPTSESFCTRLPSQKPATSLCAFYPAEKRTACKQVFDEIENRIIDCFTYRLNNSTKYGQGDAAMNAACTELTK